MHQRDRIYRGDGDIGLNVRAAEQTKILNEAKCVCLDSYDDGSRRESVLLCTSSRKHQCLSLARTAADIKLFDPILRHLCLIHTTNCRYRLSTIAELQVNFIWPQCWGRVLSFYFRWESMTVDNLTYSLQCVSVAHVWAQGHTVKVVLYFKTRKKNCHLLNSNYCSVHGRKIGDPPVTLLYCWSKGALLGLVTVMLLQNHNTVTQ